MVLLETPGGHDAIPAAVAVGRTLDQREVVLDLDQGAVVARKLDARALAEHRVDGSTVEAERAQVGSAQQRPGGPEEFGG
jgi:hypothetical protein